MTWKLNKLTRLTLLSLCSLAFSLFLCSSSASAVNIWSTGHWNGSWHDFELQARTDLPYGSMPYNTGYGQGTLYGGRIENAGYRVGDSSKRFNVVRGVLTLQQNLHDGYNSLNPNVGATGYVYDKNGNYISGPCSPYKDFDKLSYSCSITVDGYSDFEWFGVDFGNPHHPYAEPYDGSGSPPSDAVGFWYQLPTGGYLANVVYYSWSYTVESSDDPVVSSINELVSQNNQLIQQNNQILHNLSAQTDAINSQTDQLLGALNNQTSQEHSDYEAEKEEESEREQQGQDDADELAGAVDFSVSDPFSVLFGSFTASNSCINIPIIAGMLGSSETQYCPWFSPSTRNILTPIISISAIMVVYGFVIHWLKGENS